MVEQVQAVPAEPAILTTTVGSYPVPEWLVALPSEQAVSDATRVVFDTQRQAGIDLPTDGELYRFDTNHPDTNGMIEYFVRPMGGTRKLPPDADEKTESMIQRLAYVVLKYDVSKELCINADHTAIMYSPVRAHAHPLSVL